MKQFMMVLMFVLSGCSPGLMRDGGTVTNTFNIYLPVSSMARGLTAAADGQTVAPTATTDSDISSDHGSVTIILRQGTSEATVAAGLNASLPTGGM